MSISASNEWVAWVMSNSFWVWVERAGRKAKRPHLAGAAFSKTGLIYWFSFVVGHGARPHRRGYDDGRRGGGWSGSTSWGALIQPDGRRCQGGWRCRASE